MAGVRLGHKVLRNITYVVFHPSKRYKSPYLCPRCNTAHEYKAHHLDLDNEGTVIVSEGVFQALREAGLPDLMVLNPVPHPPPQVLSIGTGAVTGQIVRSSEGRGLGRLTVIKNRLLQPRP